MEGRFFITGDTHGQFDRLEYLCQEYGTSENDVVIILGDAGINYSGDYRDDMKKDLLSRLPITIFAIQGNHENRPTNIPTYEEKEWNGGVVYVEPKYPNIIFGKDGEIYDFNGKKTVVIGGAYSVDKYYRLASGYKWFEDEQPSEEIKANVEHNLYNHGWKVDVVLTHTTPLKYEPVEWFISGIKQDEVDKTTEIWLDTIEDRLEYKKWYCGHYHGEKIIDKVEFMFTNYHAFEV